MDGADVTPGLQEPVTAPLGIPDPPHDRDDFDGTAAAVRGFGGQGALGRALHHVRRHDRLHALAPRLDRHVGAMVRVLDLTFSKRHEVARFHKLAQAHDRRSGRGVFESALRPRS